SGARPGSDRKGAGRGAYTAGEWSDVLNGRLTDLLPGSSPIRSRLLHKRVDDLLFAGLVEGHDQLVALAALHRPVAEFLVEDAVAALERPFGAAVAGGDQPAFALDDRGAGVAVLRRGAGAEALGPLPARRGVAAAEHRRVVPARSGLGHARPAAV